MASRRACRHAAFHWSAETTWMALDEAALYESGSWRASDHAPEFVRLELVGGTATGR